MPDYREIELSLMDLIEELYLRTLVQQAVLDQLTPLQADWRSLVEKHEILHAPAIRELFDKFRLELLGVQPETPRAKDWQTTVRELLDEGK